MTRWRARRAVTVVGAALLACPLPGGAPVWAAGTGAPTLSSATAASDGKVTLSWTDNSTIEDAFSVHRMDSTGQFPGQWHSIGEVSTRNKEGAGGSYTWTDTASFTVSDGRRCYRIDAYNNAGTDAVSGEQCVNALPAASPAPTAPGTQPAAGGGTSHGATTAAASKSATKSAGPSAAGAADATGQAGMSGTALGQVAQEREPVDGDATAPAAKLDTKKIWYSAGAGLSAAGAVLVGLFARRSRRRRAAAGVAGTDWTPPFGPETSPPAAAGMVGPPAGAPAVGYELWTPAPADPGLPPVDQRGHHDGSSSPMAPWGPGR